MQTDHQAVWSLPCVSHRERHRKRKRGRRGSKWGVGKIWGTRGGGQRESEKEGGRTVLHPVESYSAVAAGMLDGAAEPPLCSPLQWGSTFTVVPEGRSQDNPPISRQWFLSFSECADWDLCPTWERQCALHSGSINHLDGCFCPSQRFCF